MGSILGRGTPEQTEKLGLFFEALGVAFQIMDDVLNLRGMRSGKQALKLLGEDLMEGKITYPVAKGMCLWNLEQRRKMWAIISSKPQDPAVVAEVISELDKVGALEASVDDATKMVDDAWFEVSKCLKDSFYKAMLRAFSFFVLDRHY
jgi:geranylgeranyl pyrophosphate synthase